VNVLVVTAVEAERDAVVRDLTRAEPIELGRFAGVSVETPTAVVRVVAGGVGPVAAAVATANALVAAPPYDLVVCAGIGGGFSGRADVGTVVVADRVSFADLGVRTDDGFLTVDELGLGQHSSHPVPVPPQLIDSIGAVTAAACGEILTLACMTGTGPDGDRLARRFPAALAEGMEGFGVVHAALSAPRRPRYVTELRAVSNPIGKRDRATWDIPRALDSLARACAALVQALPQVREPQASVKEPQL
jgi:futalosine hydrolase